MSRIVCIIDDKISKIISIIDALYVYFRNFKNVNDFEMKVFYVIRSEGEEEIKYYYECLNEVPKKLLENFQISTKKFSYTTIEVGEKYSDLIQSTDHFRDIWRKGKRELKIKDDDKIVYLLDLELCPEEDEFQIEQGKECLSMKLYDYLTNEGQVCKLYSSYHLNGFMERWERAYYTTHPDINDVRIVSREELYPSCFNKIIGDEIVDELK